MRKILYIFILAAVALSCVQETLAPGEGWTSDQTAGVFLRFGENSFDEIEINTKATLGVVPESRVLNIFMYIFNSEGDRVFSHYFDNSYLVGSKDEMEAPDGNCWWVDNRVLPGESEDEDTHGIIHIKAPILSGGKIYMIANIDADMVNISPEKLNTLMSEHEFNSLAATFNQEITSRNGYFPMFAMVEGIDITPEDGIKKNGADVTAEFERLDAKVMVNVAVATGYTTETLDDNGNVMKQVMQEFVPTSWRVVNLPTTCFVKPHDNDADEGYFSTEHVAFETIGTRSVTYTQDGVSQTVNSPENGFSFYMIENRETPKKSVEGNYHLRDRRTKDSLTGEYLKGGDMWEYAPEDATYLEIKGEVVMDVDVRAEAGAQTLTADVTYYIHLGDFASDRDNYSICRNTIYTYNITIKGVRNIELEVTTSAAGDPSKVEENESGATGMVYIAREDLYTFDAHYGQRVFEFDAAYVIPSEVTWYVKTPFSEGVPEKVGDSEVTANLDYKWVQFMVNETAGPSAGQVVPNLADQKVYSDKNQAYPGDENVNLMNIVEFTEFIKTERIKLQNYQDGKTATNTSAFLLERDPLWVETFPDKREKWDRYKLRVTAFVDEFYYEHDPIDPTYAPVDLWKKFVNQPNRIMHVLSDSKTSLDGESAATGSVITIRQRSIQTPYNITKTDLEHAWGTEVVDETMDSHLWFYERDEGFTGHNDVNGNDTRWETVSNLGNDSDNNGLYNTACLWGLIDGSSFKQVYWDKFLDYERVNDHVHEDRNILFLRNDFATMQYSAMLRNRDNNGNNIIDPDEVKWYVASMDQLFGLYAGQLGLHEDAALYSSQMPSQTGKYDSGPYDGADRWRMHVVSSTNSKSSAGVYSQLVLWAEEGVSTGPYGRRWHKPAPYSIRCVRNLGFPPATEDNIVDKSLNVPEPLIKVEETVEDGLRKAYFDLSNINSKSVRFYTTRDLEAYNEHFETARLYYGFETGASVDSKVYYDNNTGNGLKSDLDAGRPVCPAGWRVPNVREGALMSLYCSSDWWSSGNNRTLVSTYYSNGWESVGGNNNDTQSPSWQFGKGHASIGGPGTTGVRCVRDWNPPMAQ